MNGRANQPDRRGNNRDRAARKRWLLRCFGDGTTTRCWHCNTILDYDTIEADRIEPGGSYRHGNIIPSCRRCNSRRGNKPLETHAEATAH